MDGPDGNGDGSALVDPFLTGTGQYMAEGNPDGDDSMGDDERQSESLREQDRFLPIANVARIMKKSIPPSGKIAKETKECVQECVSEFISFITSEASERCHQEKRKTINGEDILFAMSTLGFDNYVEPLKIYLQKYRDSTKGEKVIAGQGNDGLEELTSTDDFSQYSTSAVSLPMATLPSGILTEGSAQSGNVVYASTFPAQITSTQFL